MFLDLMYWTYAHIHTNTVFIVANTYIVHFLRSLATKSGVDFRTFNSQDCALVYALLINIPQKCLSALPQPDVNILIVLIHGVHPVLKITQKFLKNSLIQDFHEDSGLIIYCYAYSTPTTQWLKTMIYYFSKFLLVHLLFFPGLIHAVDLAEGWAELESKRHHSHVWQVCLLPAKALLFS